MIAAHFDLKFTNTQHILQGSSGFQSSRQWRFSKDQSSANFWKGDTVAGRYELKASIQEALNRFSENTRKIPDYDHGPDRESMFYIVNPFQRPPSHIDMMERIPADLTTRHFSIGRLYESGEHPISFLIRGSSSTNGLCIKMRS
jgi:hypothetical protein